MGRRSGSGHNSQRGGEKKQTHCAPPCRFWVAPRGGGKAERERERESERLTTTTASRGKWRGRVQKSTPPPPPPQTQKISGWENLFLFFCCQSQTLDVRGWDSICLLTVIGWKICFVCYCEPAKKNNAFHMVSQKVFPIPERVSGHLALTHPAFMRTLL